MSEINDHQSFSIFFFQTPFHLEDKITTELFEVVVNNKIMIVEHCGIIYLKYIFCKKNKQEPLSVSWRESENILNQNKILLVILND